MRLLLLLCLTSFTFQICSSQVISVDSARSLGVGKTVSVDVIMTTGSSDFTSSLRYFQDTTGGLAGYSSNLATFERGDSVRVTGTLKDFNGLLEIDPVSSAVLISSGNPVPAPAVFSLTDGFKEAHESKLVQFNSVTIPGASGNFSGGTNYSITDGSTTKDLRIDALTDIPGSPQPTTSFDIIGVMGEYQGSYQILPRDIGDVGKGPKITGRLSQSNITQTSFDVEWNTENNGDAALLYGLTNAYELGSVTDATMSKNHSLSLSGLSAATLYYVKAISADANSDSSSAAGVMMTASASSGKMKVYFNSSVDLSKSISAKNNAVFVNNTLADTLIAFLNMATESVEIAIYNFDNDNGIVDAINQLKSNGIDVRVVADEGADAVAYNAISIGSGNKKKSFTGSAPSGGFYGIMHNKFIVLDADAADPNKAWVWTGSTNWSDNQLHSDHNNVIAIQDQSLAKAYQREFDEMFSGTFGPEKTDNTPKDFVINGDKVELHFSPTDQVETRIKETINTADEELYFAVMVWTRYQISWEVSDRHDAGVFVAGMLNDTSQAGRAYEDLGISDSFILIKSGNPIMHHKYLLVDPNNYTLDPIVLTGSHNWSSSANTRNDENTLIIHSDEIANQYFQEFVQRFGDIGGDPLLIPFNPVIDTTTDTTGSYIPMANSASWKVYPNPASDYLFIQVEGERKRLVLTDILGQTKMIFNVEVGRAAIPIPAISSGMYIISDPSSGARQKLYIQH